MRQGSAEHGQSDAHSHSGAGSHHSPATGTQEQLWYAQISAQLTKPTDRLVADIGCGQAPMAIALARALPETTRILALDSDPDVLTDAAAKIDAAGLTGQITMIEHDLTDGVEPIRGQLAGADLIWASASLHHVGDQQAVITGLSSLLAGGARLALAEGGLADRHLPWDVGVGEPGLEVRLDAVQDRWFARMRVELPGSVPMPYGWPMAMRLAGLADITTVSALFEEPTPLAHSTRDAVLIGFAHRVDRMASSGFLDDRDRASWDQLLDPADPAWLGHRDDLFSLTARTLYVGVRRH
ncbi:MAG: methyltransferase domain-containing protein [Actinomycetota bacterium]|nr:methyltransferase domain-containing protein [Actinomycetota bacterium]